MLQLTISVTDKFTQNLIKLLKKDLQALLVSAPTCKEFGRHHSCQYNKKKLDKLKINDLFDLSEK